jgi:acyl-CoA thioesterase FadM
MNLYGRMLLVLLRLLFVKKLEQVLLRSRLRFRVWVHDCDFNLHLTNSRYFSLMDLGRTDHMLRCGWLSAILKHKLKFVVNASEITFIRELPPLVAFSLSTQLLAFDDKYAYFEQRFTRKGKLHAIAHARVAIIKGNNLISLQEMAALAGQQIESPILPEAIALWKQLLDHKKWQGTRYKPT